MKVWLLLCGCDATTSIAKEVDEAGLALLRQLAEASLLAGGGCNPTLVVATEPDDYYDYIDADTHD